MQGLKCAGAFPGWTRLCDEWLGTLEGSWSEGGRTPWERPGVPLRTVAAAVARTRQYANGRESAPSAPEPGGLLRFELQGERFAVAADEWSPEAEEDLLAGAAARLEALLERSRAAADEDEHAVALLMLSPRFPSSDAFARRDAIEAMVEAFRGASLTHAMAYSFPRRAGTFEGQEASAEWPGAFLLARSARFG